MDLFGDMHQRRSWLAGQVWLVLLPGSLVRAGGDQ
jgi:hypothetical protein